MSKFSRFTWTLDIACLFLEFPSKNWLIKCIIYILQNNQLLPEKFLGFLFSKWTGMAFVTLPTLKFGFLLKIWHILPYFIAYHSIGGAEVPPPSSVLSQGFCTCQVEAQAPFSRSVLVDLFSSAPAGFTAELV